MQTYAAASITIYVAARKEREKMHLLVGTAKGLFRYQTSNRKDWTALEPVLLGAEVYASAFDPDIGTVYAGVNSEFYGPSIRPR